MHLILGTVSKCLIASQGRPKSGPEDKFRLKPVAPRLSELLGIEVNPIQDCIGEEVASAVEQASNGSVRCPRRLRGIHTEQS
jgi:phosphoglycerate kinase